MIVMGAEAKSQVLPSAVVVNDRHEVEHAVRGGKPSIAGVCGQIRAKVQAIHGEIDMALYRRKVHKQHPMPNPTPVDMKHGYTPSVPQSEVTKSKRTCSLVILQSL